MLKLTFISVCTCLQAVDYRQSYGQRVLPSQKGEPLILKAVFNPSFYFLFHINLKKIEAYQQEIFVGRIVLQSILRQ